MQWAAVLGLAACVVTSPVIAGTAAIPDWVEAYTREALAAPVSLDNAVKYRWYQLSASVRARHAMVYDLDIAPALQQLRLHGSSVTAELQRQLNARLAVVPSLEMAGPASAQCSWIMGRERGEGVTQLQIDMDRYCRDQAAPALYGRLARERAEKLDVRLSTLPHLDVAYPDRLVGPAAYVGREDVAGDYARALDRRLAEAEPVVIDEITHVYAARLISQKPMETDSQQCRELLGRWYPQGDALRSLVENDPLNGGPAASATQRFARAIGEACTRQARAWILRQRPVIEAAVRDTIAGVDPAHDPIVSIEARCTGVLTPWFPQYEGFDAALIGQLRASCRRDAAALNQRAVAGAAALIASRFEAVPRTLDGLEESHWFEPRASDMEAVTDPTDPGRREVEAALQADVAARVRPWREASMQAALREVSGAYAKTATDDAAAAPERCGPYLGDPGRSLPPGGGDIRKALTAACHDQEHRRMGRLVAEALNAAHVADVLGLGRLLVRTPDGRSVYLDPRALVAAAAVNGLQVSFTHSLSWTLQPQTGMRITPVGRKQPTLLGTLSPDTRQDGLPVWRVAALDNLPGVDGPFETLSCVAMGQDAALASVLKVGAGVFVAMAIDAPHTSGALVGDGLMGLVTIGGCGAARQSFRVSR